MDLARELSSYLPLSGGLEQHFGDAHPQAVLRDHRQQEGHYEASKPQECPFCEVKLSSLQQLRSHLGRHQQEAQQEEHDLRESETGSKSRSAVYPGSV